MSTTADVKIENATAEDFEEINELLINGFRAPISTAIGATREDMASVLPDLVKKCLSSDLSLQLVAKNSERKIIGVQLNSVVNRNETEHSEPTITPTEKGAKQMQLLMFMEEHMWDLLRADINRVMRVEITYVEPEYQRQGIARRMGAMCPKIAKELGCQGITTTSTSFKSQNLRISQGFAVLKEQMLNEWLDESGAIIFNNAEGTDRCLLTFKEI